MKRLHVHVNEEAARFEASVRFYATLFGAEPTKRRPNYAQWRLDAPSVNFVVEVLEVAGDRPGVHHLGVETDDAAELHAMRDALKAAEAPLLEIGETTCCFAKSEKNWTADPAGLRWETFRSFGDVAEYGAKTSDEAANYTAGANYEQNDPI